jgi:hypothetical protein
LTPANRFVIPDNRSKLLGARTIGGAKKFSQTVYLLVYFLVPRVKLSPGWKKIVNGYQSMLVVTKLWLRW